MAGIFTVTCEKKNDNIIDCIKVMPENISISDSVLFVTFSPPFGGDCTYQLNIDSINTTKIYISGKFESDAKCAYKGANDTINIGLLPAGKYELFYALRDVSQYGAGCPIEKYNIKFVVTP